MANFTVVFPFTAFSSASSSNAFCPAVGDEQVTLQAFWMPQFRQGPMEPQPGVVQGLSGKEKPKKKHPFRETL